LTSSSLVLVSPEHVLGDLIVKAGTLSATWHLERTLVGDASVAGDPVYGPMIGLETYTPKDYVKLASSRLSGYTNGTRRSSCRSRTSSRPGLRPAADRSG
jgi:hypothetical protein